MTAQKGSLKSVLFVPGSRPDRFDKALAIGADCIIVDFEDAVEEDLKARARDNLFMYLNDQPHVKVVVRVNAVGHPQHQEDLKFCHHATGVSAIMLPKAESCEQLESLRFLQKPLWPLLESAAGIQAVDEIAHAAGVERLTFGALDLGLDLGLATGSDSAQKVMDQVRYTILMASVGAGLAKPIDTVFADITDVHGLKKMAQNGRDMGFAGMLCIHPNQVVIANEIYSPSEKEIQWAQKVLSAASTHTSGAFRLDGRMVDAPVIRQAQRLVDDLVR